jgi:hypothetical protein
MRLVVALALMLGATTAHASCAPKEAIEKFLRESFNEVIVSSGIMPNGAMLEIYASPTGTWTAVVVKDGTACLGPEGIGWLNVRDEKPGRRA